MDITDNTLDFNKICRLCLTEETVMSSIYNEDDTETNSVPLPLRIMSCVSVEVSSNDGLPSQICATCLCQVDGWYKFKDLCENSDLLLRKCIKNEPVQIDSISQVRTMAQEVKKYFSSQVIKDESEAANQNKNLSPKKKMNEETELLTNLDNWAKTPEPEPEPLSTSKVKNQNATEQMEQCELCFNYFDKSYITIHKTKIHRVLKTVPKRKNFKCKECKNTFEFKSELLNHQSEAHPNLLEFCKLCQEKIPKINLNEHKSQVHGIKIKNTFTCQQCETIFTSRGDLQRHKFDEHCLPNAGRPIIPCEICNKTFLKTSITKHKFEVHGIRDTVNLRKGKEGMCKACGKVFERQYELNKHKCIEIEVRDKKKYCELCKMNIKEATLTRHKILHHNFTKKPPKTRKNYKCLDCKEIFINKKIYLSHRKIAHLGILKEFQCKMCLDSFDTQNLLNEHINEFGDHDGKFTCSICNRSFQSENGLRMHLNKHQKRFQCDICKMNLSSNACLKTHKAKHSNLKPFKCEKCSKSFPYSSSLKYHMQTHEDKKYVCQFCGQRFTFSFNYTRHIEQNHGKPEEKMMCDICGMLFTKRRIKDHMAGHGEASLLCDLCGKKFKLSSQVRRHKNQVHRKETVKYECSVCLEVFHERELMEAHFLKHNLGVLQGNSVQVDGLQTPVTITLPQIVLLYNE